MTRSWIKLVVFISVQNKSDTVPKSIHGLEEIDSIEQMTKNIIKTAKIVTRKSWRKRWERLRRLSRATYDEKTFYDEFEFRMCDELERMWERNLPIYLLRLIRRNETATTDHIEKNWISTIPRSLESHPTRMVVKDRYYNCTLRVLFMCISCTTRTKETTERLESIDFWKNGAQAEEILR